ncbi:MAG: hypothetical protein J0H99_00875, partial [Rhodospirillales bacterium]|nr:hypothetical protein [Rhodospirillales bacterium]
GRHAEAESCFQEALAVRPDYAPAHSNLLFSLNYRDDLPAEAITAAFRTWDARHAAPLTAAAAPHDHITAPHGRRLRIGYVSPDFRHHAVALFAEPMLAAHDPKEVELFCYAEVPVEDEVTARFRARADHWRSTVGLDDQAVADQIRADRIDVLVDLAGHTAGSRLLVFARKPAPVQVAYILGHGSTSGLVAMDAFIADATLVPPAADALFSERVVRLPRIPIAYRPPADMPAPTSLPARTTGHVTFGYFGRPERLSPRVIATWARILRVLPSARLVLNSRPFFEPAFRAMAASGELLEHAEVFGRAYGTPRAPVLAALEAGRDVLFDIDWQGTQQLKEKARDDLVSIFILPPSHEELERRLRARAQDSDDVVAGRMAKAADEISHWPEYDYVIVNTSLDKALADIQAILNAERLRRTRQTGISEFVSRLV